MHSTKSSATAERTSEAGRVFPEALRGAPRSLIEPSRHLELLEVARSLEQPSDDPAGRETDVTARR
jgi:hypothetical protein